MTPHDGPSPSPRPAYHFTAGRNWLNDPNGLLYADGQYHLFFQHNPEGATWGNMSWGHAVSTDLATWTELPVAIAHTPSEAVFSGSAVLDAENRSGLGDPDGATMVAIYTGVDGESGRQRQMLASSTDRGRTFTRHGEPVLDVGSNDFRDPKVFWHKESGCWVMVVVLSREHLVQLYRSPDLRSWEHLSDFGPVGATDGFWECPDLFRLDVDGEDGVSAWVLLVSVVPGAVAGGSGTQYFVGDFDGQVFSAVHHGWLDHGRDNYAGVTFNDTPDGRRILIGWMSNWDYAATTPTHPWRGAMTVPRELSLRRVGGQLVLAQRPVLVRHGEPQHVDPFDVRDGQALLPLTGTAYELLATLVPDDAQECGLVVAVGPAQNTRIGYQPSPGDGSVGELYLDRTRSGTTAFDERFGDVQRVQVPLEPDGSITVRVLVDACSVEVFAADGTVVLTDLIFPAASSDGIGVFAERGGVRCTRLQVQALSADGLRVPAPEPVGPDSVVVAG